MWPGRVPVSAFPSAAERSLIQPEAVTFDVETDVGLPARGRIVYLGELLAIRFTLSSGQDFWCRCFSHLCASGRWLLKTPPGKWRAKIASRPLISVAFSEFRKMPYTSCVKVVRVQPRYEKKNVGRWTTFHDA